MTGANKTHQYVIGIDVGTGSARAGLFDLSGQLLASHKRDIQMYSEEGARYEQSSQDIWNAVCACVKAVLIAERISAEQVIGLSFDATCSLVVVDAQGQPLPVGNHGVSERNIIVWMDQRATEQAHRINQTEHKVLNYVGGIISPEMETPKLLWLKEHLTETYERAGYFFDLTDFLTWQATGSLSRSICTVVCKWTYLAHEKRWDDSYFNLIGLGDLVTGGYQKIGTSIVSPGTALGDGLSSSAAEQMGLLPGTAVAAGLIDAHAGAVGSVGARDTEGKANPSSAMAYVFGTSACTLTTSTLATKVQGVWGPYYSAMLPGLWLNEAGQSAAGAAIDHLISMHPAYPKAREEATKSGLPVSILLSSQIKRDFPNLSDSVALSATLHVVPEFLGNRAPNADPKAKGLIAGLDMDSSLSSLLKLYLAGLSGIAYGLRQILEAQAERGLNVDKVVVSGGAGQDPLIRQILADATGVPVVAPKCSEPVLLGSAMLAALAAGVYSSLEQAMGAMSQFGDLYQPNPNYLDYHDKKYRAFCLLQRAAKEVQ